MKSIETRWENILVLFLAVVLQITASATPIKARKEFPFPTLSEMVRYYPLIAIGTVTRATQTKATMEVERLLKFDRPLKEITIFFKFARPLNVYEKQSFLLFIKDIKNQEKSTVEISAGYFEEWIIPINNRTIGPIKMTGEAQFQKVDAFIAKLEEELTKIEQNDPKNDGADDK